MCLTDWSAAAQIVQAVFVIIALPLAYWQIREASRATRLQALREVLVELGAPEMRRLRAEVLEMPPGESDPEKLFKARTVAVALDRVAFMAKHHLLPNAVFSDLLEGVVEELWSKQLERVVKDVRQRRGRKGYCKCLEWLVTRHLPKVNAKLTVGA